MRLFLEILIISAGSFFIAVLGDFAGAALVNFNFYAIPNSIPVIVIMELSSYLGAPFCLLAYAKLTNRKFDFAAGMSPAVWGFFLGSLFILVLLALGQFNIYIYAAAYLIYGTINVLAYRKGFDVI